MLGRLHPASPLLRWVELRGQDTRTARTKSPGESSKSWILSIFLLVHIHTIFFFSTLPSIGPHTPWKPLRKYSFCLHCSSQNASWTSVIIFTTEYFKKPWKPVSCTLSRCTETAFQLVCISSSMYGITDSHHAWTSEKLRIITLGPLLVPEGPVCDKIGVSCISKQYIQTFCILLSPLSGRSHRKKMAV